MRFVTGEHCDGAGVIECALDHSGPCPALFIAVLRNQRPNGMLRLIKFVSVLRRSIDRSDIQRATREELELRELILASDLFDPDYYLQQNNDVAKAGFDPAIHFIRHGGKERRNPSYKFDAAFYISKHPDVLAADANPLIHYLKFGRFENRQIRELERPAPRPMAPDAAMWDALASQSVSTRATAPTVDIIVPAYLGFNETANCLLTVLRSQSVCRETFEVVVIDDASPDTNLSQLLISLADKKLLTLIRNARNMGFVASVNKGMQLHDDRDVILLNSDTEVFGDWVDRLCQAAYSQKNIGTVTPFSNNATICGYPAFAGEFDGSFEVSFADIDLMASQANSGQVVDIPTAVGFCMYIRRECLHEVGSFDAKAFKRGYGEENDFSKRIAARGWRNVLAGGIFVRHLGRISFGESTDGLVKNALAILNYRYPQYNEEIANYIANDTPKVLRQRLDIERLRSASSKHNFLFISHNLGGGTAKHVRELAERLARLGIGSFFLQPDPQDEAIALLSHNSVRNLSVVGRLDLKHDLSSVVKLIHDLGIVHIHVHHLLGFRFGFGSFVQQIAQKCGINYDFTFHDYMAVCPRIEMIDGSGVYCNNVNADVCEKCITKYGSRFGDVSVWHWRYECDRFLQGARKLFAPSNDTKQHLNRFLPSLPVLVRPHPEDTPAIDYRPVSKSDSAPLHVAIIGAIGYHKGSGVIAGCAEDAVLRGLPIKFTIFGYTDQPELAKLPNVIVTGQYTERNLFEMIARAECHLAFFPAVWPETYSYTLSQCLAAGLYPVAFDIGAIAERIRSVEWGHIIPFDLVSRYPKINDLLLGLRPTKPPASYQPIAGTALYKNILKDYYEFCSLAKLLSSGCGIDYD